MSGQLSDEVLKIGADGLPTVVSNDSDLFGSGPLASRPPSGASSGDIYIVTDSGGERIDRWSGSAWVTIATASGGSGLTSSQHEVLDTLAHEVAEDYYLEVTRSGGQVSSVITWETVAKLKKIREVTVTRLSGQASVIVTKQYDSAGVLIAGQTITETVTRSGNQVSSIAAVQT